MWSGRLQLFQAVDAYFGGSFVYRCHKQLLQQQIACSTAVLSPYIHHEGNVATFCLDYSATKFFNAEHTMIGYSSKHANYKHI
jgi:hypothetical protein